MVQQDGCEEYNLGLGAAGAILEYLHKTQTNQENQKKLTHLTKLTPFIKSNHLLIDRITESSLELIYNMKNNNTNGTLFSILNNTITGMGTRLLKNWILRPLCNIKHITERQNAIKLQSGLCKSFSWKNHYKTQTEKF